MEEKKSIVLNPWFLSGEEVLSKLSTSVDGLTEEEVEKRLNIFGKNNFKNQNSLDVTKLALRQLMSPLIFILIIAAVLTGVLKEWANMVVIIFAVLINAGLGLYREYQAETTLEKLTSYIKDRSHVIRNKKEMEIESSLLVPGDIIKLSYGSRIPADCRVISSNDLKTDEAILTGESLPQGKTSDAIKESSLVADRTNMVYAGTLVMQGFATVVVAETGKLTEIGKIADIVSNTERVPTPIQRGVSQLSWYIFFITIFIVIGIFALGVSRGESILEMLVLSAAVAVGAVPEALPIALTVILSAGAERIASKKAIIRKLVAAETLGSVTLVMTDKTGTLTKADMQLVAIDTLDMLLKDKTATQNSPRMSAEQKGVLTLASKNLDVLVQNPESEEKKWKFTGHPFEVNIARAAIIHDIPLEESILRENFLHIPFNSSNKLSVSKYNDGYIIMGAPDVLLKRSNLDKEDYLKILTWIQNASMDGKRLIAVGTLST
ncbi:MAG: HAD-IC family P-type ATPase, partial [Candidatus Paceibacterota bacterium]